MTRSHSCPFSRSRSRIPSGSVCASRPRPCSKSCHLAHKSHAVGASARETNGNPIAVYNASSRIPTSYETDRPGTKRGSRSGVTTRSEIHLKPRRVPQQARSTETRAILLEAAGRVLGRTGVNVTTRMIAEVAGVSIGSLYQYFPTKEAIRYCNSARGGQSSPFYSSARDSTFRPRSKGQ